MGSRLRGTTELLRIAPRARSYPPPCGAHKGEASAPTFRLAVRAVSQAWSRAASRLGAEPHLPFLFTCQTAYSTRRRICAAANTGGLLPSFLLRPAFVSALRSSNNTS